MVLKLPWAQKQMFLVFEKSIFEFFAYFWVTKLKPFSHKARESLQDRLKSKLLIGSFLENGFDITSRSKTNLLSVWKGHFSGGFFIFLIEEVEASFKEIEAKHQKLFNSKLGHRKPLRKMVLNLPSSQKRMFWAFEKGHF